MINWGEGKMIQKLNMAHRQISQHLRSSEWKFQQGYRYWLLSMLWTKWWQTDGLSAAVLGRKLRSG